MSLRAAPDVLRVQFLPHLRCQVQAVFSQRVSNSGRSRDAIPLCFETNYAVRQDVGNN